VARSRESDENEAAEQAESEFAPVDHAGFGRRNRMRRYLESKQKEVESNRHVVRLAAELLTSHLQLVVAGSPGSIARKRSLARGIARQFDRSVRDARHCYRALCEAQADLEEARGGPRENEAIQARDAAEVQFLNAFSEVISLPADDA